MKNAFKVALIAFVIVVFGAGCLSSINEAEADTRAFFQTIIDQGSQVAYDQTSDYFKEVTPFEDFDSFIQNSGVLDFTDFQSTGYEVSTTADGLSTKTVNGSMIFNDGSTIDIYFDWVKVGEEWKVLGFGGQTVVAE